MHNTYDAIYEKGVFRPITNADPPLAEGQQVRIVVDTDGPDAILGLAARVYEGLSEQEVADVEQIALDRSRFFAEPRA